MILEIVVLWLMTVCDSIGGYQHFTGAVQSPEILCLKTFLFSFCSL